MPHQLSAAPPKRDYILFEYGLQAGAAHYFGDLNPAFQFNEPSYVLGVWGRYNLSDYIALRATASRAHIGFSDKYYPNSPFMQLRNLNFESDIWEFSIQGDFNFYAFIPKDERYFFTTYVTIGLGLVNFDPYTSYNGDKYFLRSIGTEGQDVSNGRFAYNDWALCVPLGVGVKFNIGRYVNVGFEVGYRFTSTDYLDDVSTNYKGSSNFRIGSPAYYLQDRSIEINPNRPLGSAGKQRGNQYQNDGYAFGSFFISFNIIHTPECPEDNSFKYKYKRSPSYKSPKWTF